MFCNSFDKKRFSDWFGMIRIGSDTDIGMDRNSSDWLGMNSYPILLPGLSTRYFFFNEREFTRKRMSIMKKSTSITWPKLEKLFRNNY